MPKKSQFIGRVSISDNVFIEFDLTVYGHVSDWGSILHVGIIDNDRLPGIWLHPGTNMLHFRMSDLDDYNQGYDPTMPLVLNRKYRIKFQIVDNVAKLFIDNVLVSSKQNVVHLTRYRAPIWIGDPWYNPANVKIGNLKIRQP